MLAPVTSCRYISRMGMFINLGRTLSLLRELRGKSQANVAKEAGIGKSQLSKYENGKELPKLDSLEKVLKVLDVGHFEFFYTLYLVDRRAADLLRGRREDREREDEILDEQLLPPLLKGYPMLSESTDQAFTRVFADLLSLYRLVFEQVVLPGTARPGDLKAPS
ncbi:MAG TPA: helix-turn-helix transcriptional regulator [Thermoanaerobaculia bacterium]|nr:helix-turn-helix transcriptional regulator [Thermoanaerobaculia bacterium]